MKVVIQRSKAASVNYEDVTAQIDGGLVVLVGFTHDDDEAKITYMVDKILNLRIFSDEKGHMNKSVLDINGSILSVPQFTLYGDCQKGRRPSFGDALEPNKASELFDIFNNYLAERIKIATGKFGAEMQVNITNDGPVTMIIER